MEPLIRLARLINEAEKNKLSPEELERQKQEKLNN
jgi:hypothetical protein